MKKLMIYLAVVVGCLFIGLTTYYLLKDYDVFTINQDGMEVSAENDYYLNKGQSVTLEINIEKQSDDTEIKFSYDTEGVVDFNIETGKITALKGGTTKLKIYTNKDALGFYEFNISVADGSKDYGWYIFNVADLKSIGTTRSFEGNENVYEWKFSDSYQLMNDIDLNNVAWKPLGTHQTTNENYLEDITDDFEGEFNGNGHRIKNLKVEGTRVFAGLFASMANSALFTNVIFENVNFDGYFMYAGIVAGYSTGSTISKVEVINANFILDKKVENLILPKDNNGNDEDINYVGGILGAGATETGTENVATNSINLCSFNGTIEIAKDAAATTRFQIGGICGSGFSVELMNNKSTLNLKTKDYIEYSNTTVVNSFGGIIGTSFCEDIDFEKTLDEQPIFYPIIKNNLSIFSYDAVNGKMNGTVGQRAIKSVTDKYIAEYLTANPDKTDKVDELLRRVNELIQVRIAGNIFVLKTEEIGQLPFKGENEGEETYYYAGTIKKSEVDLKNIETFTNLGWNISENSKNEPTAWVIEGENVPTINIDGANETTELTQKYIELNKSNFEEYVNKMLNSRDAVAKFWLSREYKLTEDIDLAETSFKDAWTPIFGIKNDYVFTGVLDGDGHTISNVKIVNLDDKGKAKYDTVGLFATISRTAVVKNLKLVGVDIDYADYAGAIAGINAGKVMNVQVEGVHIANAKTAGLVVGFNDGLIETTNKQDDKLVYTVLVDAEGVNKVASDITNKSVFLGGVAGYNSANGKIAGVKIEANFELSGKKADVAPIVKMIGGIAGYNGGLIENCSVENASISDSSTVFTYLGGIAGLTNGTITNCYAGVPGDGYSIAINGNVEENNIIIGGIAGQISNGAKVEKCFVKADLSGYYIGGVAANLFGTVRECYVLGSFTGSRVGGISVNVSISDTQEIGGDVKDCYVGATLNGYTEDAMLAGLSVYIVKPGKFENVIISCVFSGKCAKYYESYTDTRVSFFNFFKKINGTKLGHVYNIVIDDSINDKSVKKNGGAINFEGQSAYYVNSETLKSGENFYKEKGYSVAESGEWQMEPQKTPILRALNLDAINAEPETAEQTETTPEQNTETPVDNSENQD